MQITNKQREAIEMCIDSIIEADDDGHVYRYAEIVREWLSETRPQKETAFSISFDVFKTLYLVLSVAVFTGLLLSIFIN